jgi:hypothetical protein
MATYMIASKHTSQNPQGPGSRRRRSQIYGERRTVSVRMEPKLHQRMMDLCDELTVSANSYINGLIEANLKKRKK